MTMVIKVLKFKDKIKEDNYEDLSKLLYLL